MRSTLARFAAAGAALCLVLAVAAAAQEKAAPPPGHPMAKIHPGMVQEQVRDILGAPTSTFSYRPGQAWIPWNYAMGRDQQRYEWYYKGKGVVIFNTRFWWSGSPTVWRVDYDPNEDGYHN